MKVTQEKIKTILDKNLEFIRKEQFKGYDPYDILNSKYPINKLGNNITFLLTQLHKRNPINIRKLLNIPKDYVPKGMGLFLKALCIKEQIFDDGTHLKDIKFIYNWLIENYSQGYSGYCWGLNFAYSPRGDFQEAYLPSIVATSFVHDGIYHYYRLTKDTNALEVLESACRFVMEDIPRYEDEKNLCFSYTPLKKDRCFNANMLGARMLALTYSLNEDEKLKKLAKKCVNFTIKHQLKDGRWNYAIRKNGTQKEQIDFHQGFIIDCMRDYILYTDDKNPEYINSIEKGLNFYYENQITEEGQALWRYPVKWPVDIHNQAQAIITFSQSAEYSDKYLPFAEEIAGWTIDNMWDSKGYFYYRKGRFLKNKINYIRWGQAWMFYALNCLIKSQKINHDEPF